MANNTWSSAGSTNGNLGTNWSLGALTPTDVLVFDATSVVNCSFPSALSVAGISLAAAYSGELSFAIGVTQTIGASGFTDLHAGNTVLGIGAKLNVSGSVVIGAAVTMASGFGSSVNLTGTSNCNLSITTAGVSTLNIAKTSATALVTCTGGVQCDSILFTGGLLDPNGQTFATSGDFDIQGGNFPADADIMDSAVFNIGGNADWTGGSSELWLRGNNAWEINSPGTVNIYWSNIARCATSTGTVVNLYSGATYGGANPACVLNYNYNAYALPML